MYNDTTTFNAELPKSTTPTFFLAIYLMVVAQIWRKPQCPKFRKPALVGNVMQQYYYCNGVYVTLVPLGLEKKYNRKEQ